MKCKFCKKEYFVTHSCDLTKTIFKEFARDGECYHEDVRLEGEYTHCLNCGLEPTYPDKYTDILNPDFTQWSGAGWILERLPEWNYHRKFVSWFASKRFAQNIKGKPVLISVGMLEIFKLLKSPKYLCDTIADFIKEGE